MARLLFVHHTVSPATHGLQLAAMEGLRMVTGVDVEMQAALTASPVQVLAADGYLLGSPVNLGYLAGATKHFFDVVYYTCIEQTRGRPYCAYLHANGDATGALRAIDAIAGAGLGWRQARPPLVVAGEPGAAEREAVTELAAAFAAGLTLS